MSDRTRYRLADDLDAVEQIEELLASKVFDDLISDRPLKAAFERFLEILSEAAKHIPQELRDMEPEIEWRNIGNIGNHLRHAYHRVDADILWNLYAHGKLAELKEAILRISGRDNSGKTESS